MGDVEAQPSYLTREMEIDEEHVLSEFGRSSPAAPAVVLGRVVTLLISLGVTVTTFIFVTEFTLPGFFTIALPFIALAWFGPRLRGIFAMVDDRSYGLSMIWASTIDGAIMIYLSMTMSYFVAFTSRETRRHPYSVFTLVTFFFMFIFVGFAAVHYMRMVFLRILNNKNN